MKIRNEQMDALSQAALKDFENRMVVHLNEFFPEQCKALGEKETRAAIREGIERAATYQIVTERDVCGYIDLMFALGRRFDRDTTLPWASSILNDRSSNSWPSKADRLYAAAMQHIRIAARTESYEED